MNDIITHENTLLGEKYIYTKHKSGLDIYFIPKDTTASYALFCTRCGSIDNCFRLEGESEFTRVPDGIAHYLEHKMFENADGSDTFTRFSEHGASANAFTYTEGTAYLFKCTENFRENLKILLEYVSSPYFTEENVEKERGIIAQEIRGREDYPDFALYMNLLDALYESSQIKIDVAGSVESIKQIDAAMLYKCYDVFYDLSNMYLVVAGNTDISEILSVADDMLPIKEPKKAECSYGYDGKAPVKKYVEKFFDISKPMFLLGIKDVFDFTDAERATRRGIAAQLLTETLFGDSSEFAVSVYESGLIDELDTGYSSGKIHGMFVFGGETNDIEKCVEVFWNYIEETKKRGINEEDFERARRVKYAEFIRSFESVEIAETFAMSLSRSQDYFSVGDIIESITLEEAQALLSELFTKEDYALSAVYPTKKD